MPERKLRRGPRRRSERLPAQIPVQLAGASETGQEFTENSQTLTLSQHGASILSKRKLMPNQQMTIRRLDTGKEARVRVAGRIGDRAEGYVYSVEFVDLQANLWETEFPSTPDPDETEDLAFLVCGCCGKREAVQLGESKLADFELAHGVLLYCIQCQAMTRWMQRSEDAAPGDRRSG
ncbi:MAG TPA: PilZ domain-containing protein [Candidatus Acidoferrum sp.]|nr:PilZ domain-containing protein [Candidatus Acidoferrum sp.]